MSNGNAIQALPFTVEYPRRTQDIAAAGPFLFRYENEAPPAAIVLTDTGTPPGLAPVIGDAPYDGTTYGRNNGRWVNIYDAGTY